MKEGSYPFNAITLPVPNCSSTTKGTSMPSPPKVLPDPLTAQCNSSDWRAHPASDDAFGFEGEVTLQRDSFGTIIGIVLDPYWVDGGPIPKQHTMQVTGMVRYAAKVADGG